MRVLLLHPEDDPASQQWTRERWDRVIDLGFAGEGTYLRWSQRLGCPVGPLPKLRIEEFGLVRQALAYGYGLLVDNHGLDWWELISIRFHEQIALIVRLQKLAEQIFDADEICITRDGDYASILKCLVPELRCYRKSKSSFGKVRRMFSSVRRLSFPQILQTLGDKYDAGYRIRRWTAAPRKLPDTPVVLLPAAHVTAARMAVSYAGMLTETRFLLVATRRSGCVGDLPQNTSAAMLAAYAPGRCDGAEYKELIARWRDLQLLIANNPQIEMLQRLGMLLDFPRMLRDGLAIRDAWLGVFAREQISAVLCTDDANPYTHIPVLLARERGLPTIACHHGALDGQNLMKRNHAEIVLAKGRMEQDYLVNTCGLPAEKIVLSGSPVSRLRENGVQAKDSILFISEPYELDGGRTGEIYREVLPELARVARRMKLNLVIKLHPMEIPAERLRIVRECLESIEEAQIVTVMTGKLSDELLEHMRLAVAIQSTAAVDCRVRGIPVFLCQWLDCGHFGYVNQFVDFHAGMPLRSAVELANIPDLLPAAEDLGVADLRGPVDAEKLQRLLNRGMELSVAV